MRKSAAWFIILIFAAPAFPQAVKLGLNFGVNYNMASYERSSLIWDVEKSFSPRLGMVAAYGSGGSFRLISAVIYDGKAGRFSTLGAADGLAIVTERYHYLALTQKLQYDSRWGFFINLGPAMGIKLKAARERKELYSIDLASYKSEIENAKSVRWGLVAGGGYEIAVGGIQLAPEVSYDFGLTQANMRNHLKLSSLVLGLSMFF
ncbi:MAG: outer membrane beta-barrel protein [bacterium]